MCSCVLRCGTAGSARIKNGAHSGGQKDVSIWKKYRAWDGAQPFETVLRTKNGEWVQTQGFDPFTQSVAYYRLTGDASEANTVEVSVQNASRDAVYAPASMEKVTDGDMHERRDALLKGRGLFGTRNYTVTEVLGTRPSELMVAESWVSSQPMRKQSRSIAALCMMHIPQRTRNCCLCSTVCSGRIMMMKMTVFTVRSAASARC